MALSQCIPAAHAGARTYLWIYYEEGLEAIRTPLDLCNAWVAWFKQGHPGAAVQPCLWKGCAWACPCARGVRTAHSALTSSETSAFAHSSREPCLLGS